MTEFKGKKTSTPKVSPFTIEGMKFLVLLALLGLGVPSFAYAESKQSGPADPSYQKKMKKARKKAPGKYRVYKAKKVKRHKAKKLKTRR